jgi:hypothetical protein
MSRTVSRGRETGRQAEAPAAVTRQDLLAATR